MKKHAKRYKLTVLYDLLVCCSIKPMIVSDIAKKANLNNSFVRKLANNLVRFGLLSKHVFDDGKTYYSTSCSGRDFIRKYSNGVKPLLSTLENIENIESSKDL